MALFGSIVSTVISAACSVGSAICSGLSKAASTIGGFVSGSLESLSKIIAKIPEIDIIEKTIEVIGNIVKGISETLGLIDKEDTPEELGAKAFQAEEKPEDFDSVEKYIEYLKNEVELDKEKFDNMSKEEKLTCSAVGSTVLAKGISEKKGIEVSTEFLVDVAKLDLKAKEVESYIDNFKANNLELNLGDYLKGNLSASENIKIRPVVIDTIKELNPNLSDKEVKEKLGDMKDLSLEK